MRKGAEAAGQAFVLMYYCSKGDLSEPFVGNAAVVGVNRRPTWLIDHVGGAEQEVGMCPVNEQLRFKFECWV